MKRLFIAALLALSSTVFAATLAPVQLLNPAGSTAGQAIVSTGASTAPAWGNVTATALSAQAANTVVANVTGASASPTAFAMPSCSTANSALYYTNGIGFGCRTNTALTGNPLSQFAATTSAQLLGVISDETGSGALVFGTSPTLASPTVTGTLGAAAITASGLITPSSTVGIKGTATNDSAQAGSIGEVAPSTVLPGAALSLTTATAKDITSISLTAGNWNVWGSVFFRPGSTTVSNQNIGWISTTSATLPTFPNNGAVWSSTSAIGVGVGDYGGPVGTVNLKLASTTTVFLSAYSNFSTSTNSAYGFIAAIRVR